jgi:sarcosine oxidase subunit beta
MTRYSIFSLVRNALGYHEGWQKAWRSPDPKADYDVIVIGGGGHGLATAYYLAKEHGLTNVAVLEKGWLGGGNTGRNTTVVRSNYLLDESAAFYDRSHRLYEGLSQDLNYNVMFSPRGLILLQHSHHQMEGSQRLDHAMRLNGIDTRMLSLAEVAAQVPILDISPTARYPVVGGLLQQRAGTARHDAVAWGFARGADARGVDIIQNCEVTAIHREGGRVTGVETTRGAIRARKVGTAVAGHSSVLGAMAGLRLPIQSFPLQALVSEPLKPMLDTVVISTVVHVYISQSDKGELVMGASRDAYPSYAQRGSFHIIENQMSAVVQLYPVMSRLKMLRQWAGIIDVSPDASPIISKTSIEGFYINGGWGPGGFKATPASGWCYAHTIARDEPHPLNAGYRLDRFASGRLIDENAAGGVGH